MNQGVAERAGL